MKRLLLSFILLVQGAVFAANWDIRGMNRAAEPSETAHLFVQEFLDGVEKLVGQSNEALEKERLEFINLFRNSPTLILKGLDSEIRPLYVGVQGDIERALAYYLHEGKIVYLVGIIHTPTPPTPLCTEGEISAHLVDPSVERDSARLYTVMKRPQIIRELLKNGGVVIAAYPECGLNQRTEEQLKVFSKVKEDYPENLIDLPLFCSDMDSDMIGATYFFKTREGDMLSFSIRASQANAPEDGKIWGMWLGPISNYDIYDRAYDVLYFLHMHQPRDLGPLIFGEL